VTPASRAGSGPFPAPLTETRIAPLSGTQAVLNDTKIRCEQGFSRFTNYFSQSRSDAVIVPGLATGRAFDLEGATTSV
jgi:hypothetical protein